MFYYHGTDMTNLASILKEGIRPTADTDSRWGEDIMDISPYPYYYAEIDDILPSVFVADSAEEARWWADESGIENIRVLKISSQVENLENFHGDGNGYKTSETIPKEYIVEVIDKTMMSAEDNSKLFSSIVKDIWNRFSVMKWSGDREKYLQRQINSRIRLNSGYGGQNKEANDRYFQAIRISDTDLRYYISTEWDDGPVEFNKLTQESLKRVADLQNDLRTKYNNPSIKLDVHENTTVRIEGSGVFVVEISMDAHTASFDAEESGSPTYWAGSVAKAIVNEMGDDYYFNEDLSDEYNCVHFAQEMSEYLTQDEIPHEIQSFAGYGGEVAHAWVYVPLNDNSDVVEGEYYDAWTPYGVSDWKDLGFWETLDYTPEWLEQQTPESFEAEVHLLPDAPMAGWYDPRDDSVNINLANKGIRNEALEDNYSGLFDTIAHEYGHKVTSHETRSPYHSEFAAFMVQTNGDFARSKLLAVIHPMCFQEIIMKLPHSNGMISDETLDDFFSTLDFENNLDIIVQAKRFVTYPTIPEWHKEWLKHLISYVETGTAANVTFDAEESGSPTSTQLLNWITQPKTITTAPDGKATEKPKNFDWESEPTRCVWCSSADINSMTPEHQEEGLIYSHVGCNDCSCIWREEYRYVENEIIQAGEKRTLKSEDEQLSIEIEDIDETYGLIPSDPEMLSWAESAVSQYLSRTDLPKTFQLHTNPHFVFVSADAFGRSSHLARFRSHTSSHIPIIMLCSEAIRQSADDYGVSLKTAVETTVWHELGHVLCELWWDVEGIYPFESSNDEEEFAESIAKSMFFQESFQNPVV